jgi:NitT/TauT family transport system substrate-binding protein
MKDSIRYAVPKRSTHFDGPGTGRLSKAGIEPIRRKRFHSPLLSAALALLCLIPLGCKREQASQPIALTLDWKPEPEFGGFYQADLTGLFKSHGLDVVLKSAGAGAPTWQLVASKQTDFATTAADQVLIARSSGADVVAIFAVYQTFPQGIMVHRARGLHSIEDVFTHPGTLAAEDDAWLKYLLAKFPDPKVTITGYGSGIAAFLAKPDYSQQCFVTSEPLLAKRAGGDPQTFLIADAGYNPYTTVLITRGEIVRDHPDRVKAMVEACREGWRQYLIDPSAANATMGKLNTEMDAQTFKDAAAAQKPLIQTENVPLGSMSVERWRQLGQQLLQLKVIDKAPAAEQCFVDMDKLPGKS